MLEVMNVTKKYEEIDILNSINFVVPKGAIVSLTGKNGIGKTTLLNILGGISEFEGDINLNNISIRCNLEDYMDITTLIPTTPFLYDYLTVSEMIDLAVGILGENDNLYRFKNEMIEQLEMKKFEDILVKNLSLGTKQKLAFIIGFLDKPKLILIDEPFVNFDETSMEKILYFIRDYTIKEEAIIIFSTHSKDLKINHLVTHNININSKEEIRVTKVGG